MIAALVVLALLAPLGVFLSLTALNVFLGPFLRSAPPTRSTPMVSILVPARNEAANIGACLRSLAMQDYGNYEILVLNDCSEDETAEIVEEVMQHDARVRLIHGEAVPTGWTGKNWACHQLSEAAGGDILVFTDADNRHAPGATSATIGWLRARRLDLLSAFPQQTTQTVAEKLVVPSIYMTVYSYLPLWLTLLLPFPSLAAANGQWLVLTRHAYEGVGGHAAVRREVVEDMALARLAKSAALRTLALAGTGMVFGRMYRGWREVLPGFSKNAFGLADYRPVPFLFLLALMLWWHVVPYPAVLVGGLSELALTAVALNIMVRALLAWRLKDNWLVVLLHPLAILLAVLIGLNSMRLHFRGGVRWKGRPINRRTHR